MAANGQIVVRSLAPPELEEQLDALADVLFDCVDGGASVSYMAPFSHDDARAAFAGFAAEVKRGNRLLLAAFDDGELVGTVQVILALPPNQPHRGEIAKLLVHRRARRRGVAQLLMEHAEAEARAAGKSAARPRHGHRRSGRAALFAAWLEPRRRHPWLRALSRRTAMRHDGVLEGALAVELHLRAFVSQPTPRR